MKQPPEYNLFIRFIAFSISLFLKIFKKSKLSILLEQNEELLRQNRMLTDQNKQLTKELKTLKDHLNPRKLKKRLPNQDLNWKFKYVNNHRKQGKRSLNNSKVSA